MKTMIISEFKAKCIGALKEVEAKREPILITLRGRPIAGIEPVRSGQRVRRLGAQRGSMRICGDIVSAGFPDGWNMLSKP